MLLFQSHASLGKIFPKLAVTDGSDLSLMAVESVASVCDKTLSKEI